MLSSFASHLDVIELVTIKRRLLAATTSLLLILIIAFAARVAFAWDQERKIPRDALAIVPFAQETGNIAYALAAGKGFSSPFRNDTGPTAWLPPVYPVILAGIFRVFGPLNIPSLNAAIFFNILCSTLTCIPIFYVGKRIGGQAAGLATGSAAAWLWALLPAAVMLPFEWIWDTSLSALLAVLLLWGASLVADSRALRDWSVYGLLGGFALLTNTALGALFVPWLGWAAYRSLKHAETNEGVPTASSTSVSGKSAWTRAWHRPALAGAVAILCCVPWTIRNYGQFHRFIPIRSNFSFELWSGNNNIFDPHTGNAMARITLYGEVRQYTQLGETGYMRDKWRKATLFIRTHPELEMKLMLARIISTWLGTQRPVNDFMSTDLWLPRLVFLVNGLLLAGTISGVILLYRGRNALAFPLAAGALIFPVVYYITHTSLRYRHPLDPVLVLLTAVCGVAIARGVKNRGRGRATPGPVVGN